MLLRLAYLGITNVFALLRLLPGSDRDKDAEILALRRQLAVLQRQLDGQRIRFDPTDRAWLAALLHQLPRPSLHRLRLLVRPDTPGVGESVAGVSAYLVRDRDGKYPTLFDSILADAGITNVLTGVRVSRMNSIMERWGTDLPPRTTRPHLDLEPTPPTARTERVRDLL